MEVRVKFTDFNFTSLKSNFFFLVFSLFFFVCTDQPACLQSCSSLSYSCRPVRASSHSNRSFADKKFSNKNITPDRLPAHKHCQTSWIEDNMGLNHDVRVVCFFFFVAYWRFKLFFASFWGQHIFKEKFVLAGYFSFFL